MRGVALTKPAFENEFEKMISETETLRRGQVVRGTVVSITEDSAIINIGHKYDGIVPLAEFGEKTPQTGSELPVIVKKVDERAGVIYLSCKSAERKEVIQRLKNYKEKKVPLKGVILKKVKGGYLVDIDLRGFRGFLIDELSGAKKNEKLEEGQEIEAFVDAIDFRRKRVVLDRATLIEKQKEDEIREFLGNIEAGQKLKGRIKSITDFGIFVDVGPLDVLIRKSNLSWKRIKHPSELFKEGDQVEFVVISVNPEKKKIQGSIKSALKTKWHAEAEKVHPGEVFEATVKKISQGGIYLWLKPGLDGFLPAGEFSKYIRDLNQLNEGDKVRVRIKSIDMSRRMIYLTHPTR